MANYEINKSPNPIPIPNPQSQNRNYTEAQLLGFSYDFDVTVIRHQNTDAMVLASVLMRGIHPPDNIQNGRRPVGNCLS
jgi:hypothetical protein